MQKGQCSHFIGEYNNRSLCLTVQGTEQKKNISSVPDDDVLIVPRINSLVFSLSPSYMHTGFSLLFCYLANLQQKVQPWLWGFVSYTVWIKSGSFPSNSWNIVVCLFTNSGIPSGLQILSWSCIFCATLMWKDKISACLPSVTQWYFARHCDLHNERGFEKISRCFFLKLGSKPETTYQFL